MKKPFLKNHDIYIIILLLSILLVAGLSGGFLSLRRKGYKHSNNKSCEGGRGNTHTQTDRQTHTQRERERESNSTMASSETGPDVCTTCTLEGRLTSTEYLEATLGGGAAAFNLVIFFAVAFFMVVSRFIYAAKLWCMYHGKRIPSREKANEVLVAAKKDDDLAANSSERNSEYAYSLKSALALDDNKALAIAMAGYMFGTGIITKATVSDLNRADGWLNVALVFAWQAIGVVLMEITRLITDHVVVPGLSLPEEVIKKRNIAAGIVEGCAYISSGQVISASLSGPANSWAVDILSVLMWFVVGQASFIAFAALMRCRTPWSLAAGIKSGNAAAATVFGLNKITIAMFLTNAISKSDALLTFAVWFTIGTFVLISTNYIIDVAVIPGAKLGDEIRVDRNWGAALVVGCMKIGVTIMLNTFLPDTCQNLT